MWDRWQWIKHDFLSRNYCCWRKRSAVMQNLPLFHQKAYSIGPSNNESLPTRRDASLVTPYELTRTDDAVEHGAHDLASASPHDRRAIRHSAHRYIIIRGRRLPYHRHLPICTYRYAAGCPTNHPPRLWKDPSSAMKAFLINRLRDSSSSSSSRMKSSNMPSRVKTRNGMRI